MNKQLKNLTWYYFIQQKILELILIPSAIVFIPYWLGLLYIYIYETQQTGIYATWVDGLIMLVICILILILLLCFMMVIYSLIEWNWDMAKKRAEKKLKLNQLKGGRVK